LTHRSRSVPVQFAQCRIDGIKPFQGKNEGLYPINAAGDAAIGKWPIMVIGAADINGQAWVSSQLADLDVAERYVTFDMKRSACDKGQPAQIQCTLAHATAFEGKAKAELLARCLAFRPAD
jgi:hypothetical protein